MKFSDLAYLMCKTLISCHQCNYISLLKRVKYSHRGNMIRAFCSFFLQSLLNVLLKCIFIVQIDLTPQCCRICENIRERANPIIIIVRIY